MPQRRLSKRAYCFLLIFLCFFWTSGSFLSWLYRVMEFLDAQRTDLLCEVAAYVLQALGIGLFALAAARRPKPPGRAFFAAVTALDLACAALSVLTGAFWSVCLFGLLMNVLHGVIAGCYLRALAWQEHEGAARVFGGGYALAVILAWLLALPGNGAFPRAGAALLVYAAAAAVSLLLPAPQTEEAESAAEAPADGASGRDLLLLSAAVLSMSLVKNMGFSFPAADLQSGTSLELTRVFYAVGLALSGVFLDRRREYGFPACAITLVLPFVMLLLSRETVPASLLWCLDYFFYGFFSVFRVILFTDHSLRHGRLWLSGFGLLFGRLGDALGTGLYIALSGAQLPLVLLTSALFIGTASLLFAVYRRFSAPPPPAPEPAPIADPFERFSERYGLSRRECEVLRLLLQKRSNPEISEALSVSDNTVKFHVRNILQKTACKNRVELLEKFRAEQ